MPVYAYDIPNIAKVAITHYGKNKPTDQINVERPLLDALIPKAKQIIGGVDGFTINVYKSNDSNLQMWSGNMRVTYNQRDPNELAKYDWHNTHEGFTLNEDSLKRAGISVTDDKGVRVTRAESVALTDMLLSHYKALEEGCKDSNHKLLWLDGSQYPTAQPGIDAIVSLTPSVGAIGNLASSNAWWQNYAQTGIATTQSAMLDALEKAKRSIMRTKGRFTHIFCGADFYDALRNAVMDSTQTSVNYSGGAKISIDLATNNLKFDGVPLIWVPDFDTNFGLSAPAIPWTKRCYMLNLSNEDMGIGLRRDKDDFMRMRYPGRPIDQYVYYFAMTSKFGLGCGKRNTHAVLSI